MGEAADYVIVGGGSAGCVMANRLSENPANSVILLEAGGHADSFMNRMPAGGMTLLGKPETDWLYQTEPDPSLNGRVSYWSAGRLLGGGSSVNGMIYIRGDRSDYVSPRLEGGQESTDYCHQICGIPDVPVVLAHMGCVQ